MTAPARPYAAMKLAILNQRSSHRASTRRPFPVSRQHGKATSAIPGARGQPEPYDSPGITHQQRKEGDLILGLKRSAIGTLAERSTRFTLLLHLPPMAGHGEGVREKNGPALAGHGAQAVRDAIVTAITTLPTYLKRSLAWDQGTEMAQHAQLRIDTGLKVYFCDPQSPWQRGTNENTNGLLRQYFPKGTDLSGYHPDYLEFVANQLNDRPRKRLDWKTPKEALEKLLSNPIDPPGVAKTG